MWVNSKQAAEFLRVKYETIKKTIQRAEKAGKKFCTINGQNCLFSRINGNVGGAAGKTLQIWIDDDLINDKNSEISQAGKASRVNWENDARARLLNSTNGESDGDTKLDTRDSVDIRGGNGGVFGAGFASTGDRRDQKQTQISQNERINDGDIPRVASTDAYDTCAGSERTSALF